MAVDSTLDDGHAPLYQHQLDAQETSSSPIQFIQSVLGSDRWELVTVEELRRGLYNHFIDFETTLRAAYLTAAGTGSRSPGRPLAGSPVRITFAGPRRARGPARRASRDICTGALKRLPLENKVLAMRSGQYASRLGSAWDHVNGSVGCAAAGLHRPKGHHRSGRCAAGLLPRALRRGRRRSGGGHRDAVDHRDRARVDRVAGVVRWTYAVLFHTPEDAGPCPPATRRRSAHRLTNLVQGDRSSTSAVGPCSPPSPKRTRGSRTRMSIRDRPSRPLHTTAARHRSRGVPARRLVRAPQASAEPVSTRIQPGRSAAPGVAPLKPETARCPQGSGGFVPAEHSVHRTSRPGRRGARHRQPLPAAPPRCDLPPVEHEHVSDG